MLVKPRLRIPGNGLLMDEAADVIEVTCYPKTGRTAMRVLSCFVQKLDEMYEQDRLTGPNFHQRPVMLILPEATVPVTNPIATLFQRRTWTKI